VKKEDLVEESKMIDKRSRDTSAIRGSIHGKERKKEPYPQNRAIPHVVAVFETNMHSNKMCNKEEEEESNKHLKKNIYFCLAKHPHF